MLDKDVFIAYKNAKEEIERDHLGMVSDKKMLDLIFRQNELIMSLLLKKEYDEICRENAKKKEVKE